MPALGLSARLLLLLHGSVAVSLGRGFISVLICLRHQLFCERRVILWRDNLDENGCGNLEIEATAGSGPIIIWSSELRKHFLSISLLDWR